MSTPDKPKQASGHEYGTVRDLPFGGDFDFTQQAHTQEADKGPEKPLSQEEVDHLKRLAVAKALDPNSNWLSL